MRSCIQYALREFFEAYTNSDMVETNQELVVNGCTEVCLNRGKNDEGCWTTYNRKKRVSSSLTCCFTVISKKYILQLN